MSRAVRLQGIECPLIKEGDNIVDVVVRSVLNTVARIEHETFICGYESDDITERSYTVFDIKDKDVIGITESVVARAAGQYVTVDEIAIDIEKKFGKDATICLVNPIYSRNRFSMILKGIARAAKKVIIIMSEKDEVGNPRGVNKFTGVNIEEYYKEICESEGCECIIDYTECKHPAQLVCHATEKRIYCMLHDYEWCRKPEYYAYSLADICSDKSPDWGLLGTNKATEERLKLFPSKAECQRVCEGVKEKIKEKTGKDVIVCIYGDGCFKDPVGGIWEFADPTTMPGYTDAEIIESTPKEVKLKSFIDFGCEMGLKTDEDIAGALSIRKQMEEANNGGDMGTTPRLFRDLLASSMDLTSGSGDRATPVVLIQNYF